jgi:hypothetical protein
VHDAEWRKRIQDRVDDGARRADGSTFAGALAPSGFVGLGTSRSVTEIAGRSWASGTA